MKGILLLLALFCSITGLAADLPTGNLGKETEKSGSWLEIKPKTLSERVELASLVALAGYEEWSMVADNNWHLAVVAGGSVAVPLLFHDYLGDQVLGALVGVGLGTFMFYPQLSIIDGYNIRDQDKVVRNWIGTAALYSIVYAITSWEMHDPKKNEPAMKVSLLPDGLECRLAWNF